MPIKAVLLLMAIAAMLGWMRGWSCGYDEADKRTEYWFQNSQEWMRAYFRLRDDDDNDGEPIPEDEPEPEPVKAMAKSAGANR